jgi:DNA-directed RNA polymerase subunit L
MATKPKYISNISYPLETTTDKTRKYVEFHIDNISHTIINCIRRTIISEVKTVGFRSEPYEDCDINFLQNDTPLHNQLMAHRIAQIPIYVANTDTFAINDYEFIIDEDNDTNFPKDITSEHFKVRHISTDKFMARGDVKKMFPPDPITNNYILITRLKPKHYAFSHINSANLSSIFKSELGDQKSDENIRLFIKAKASISNGSDNGHYNPTCCAAYEFRVNKELSNNAKFEYIEKQKQHYIENNLTMPSDTELETRFYTSKHKRCFYTDDAGNPNKYLIKVESIGAIPPLIIYSRAIQLLREKLDKFRNNIIVGNIEEIDVTPSKELENGFDIKIFNENETLGTLLQKYITILYTEYDNIDRIVNFVGYRCPHPLTNEVIIVIQPVEKMEWAKLIDAILLPACSYVSKLLDTLMKDLEKTPQYANEVKLCK